MSGGDLISAEIICNAPCVSHCTQSALNGRKAQIWQIGRLRYKICQDCGGCYGVSDNELAEALAASAPPPDVAETCENCGAEGPTVDLAHAGDMVTLCHACAFGRHDDEGTFHGQHDTWAEYRGER
jgi:hypothetical protein